MPVACFPAAGESQRPRRQPVKVVDEAFPLNGCIGEKQGQRVSFFMGWIMGFEPTTFRATI